MKRKAFYLLKTRNMRIWRDANVFYVVHLKLLILNLIVYQTINHS
jgi:hypothetical protein